MGILDQFIVWLLMFVVPVLYTSVGFAGGSAFVAMLLLLGYSPGDASFYGLAFNSISAATSLVRWRIHFERSLAWYLVGAVPLAYIGGQLRIYEETLRIIMGGAIILSGTAALVATAPLRTRSINAAARVLVGGAIGFLAGMTGIGGGIYLSPFIILSGEALPKQTAATTTLFILLNSLSGLLGKSLAGNVPKSPSQVVLVLLPLIVLGASLGSYLGSKRLRQDTVKKILGILLIVIGSSVLLLGQ